MAELYSPILLAISFCVSLVAAYTSLSLATLLRATVSQQNKFLTVVSSAITMGLGMWSMHYVGMLTHQIKLKMLGYDISLMILSIVVALLSSLLAIYVISSKDQSDRRLTIGAIIFAISTVLMHYIGMFSAKITAHITWDINLIILSIFVMTIASLIAVFLSRKHQGKKGTRKYLIVSSIVLGVGIAVMHEIGMSAAHYDFINQIPAPNDNIMLANSTLNYTVLTTTTIIFVICLITSWLSKIIQTKEKKVKEMQELFTAAENANLTKTRFVANMSHELRTPLSAIVGFTELIKSENPSPAEQMEYLDIIQKSANSLVNIIDDILDLSSIELNRLKIIHSNFELDRLLQEIFNIVEINAKPKGIKLSYSIDTSIPNHIKTDRLRLRQIIINLVNNAIKFTREGYVKLEVTKQGFGRSETLVFRVLDSGIGITPENQKLIFNPFFQVDNSYTREYSGTGLGLDISHRLAGALGGSLILESSQPNVGTTFKFTIPLLAESMPNSQSGAKIDNSFKGKRPLAGLKILLVEDVIDNQILIKRILENRGAEVELAENGILGNEMALSRNYDLILMDVQMPIQDGKTSTRILRQAGFTKPIIAITAHAMSDEKKQCLEAGFTSYLTKPLNIEDLLEAISEFQTV